MHRIGPRSLPEDTLMHAYTSRTRCGLAALLAAFTVGTAVPMSHAQDNYPSRPIRLVVPFPPGGGTDITSRLVATGLTEAWGQSVIIDNRPGAGTQIGTEIVQRSAPDGYTLLIVAAAHSINPSLYKKVSYHPTRDFTPLTLAISFPFVLATPASLPAKTVKELIGLAKAQPGKLSYASSGTGNTNHLAGELFKLMAGVDIVHIPYKGGGPAMIDLLSGQVSMHFGAVLQTLPQVRSGKLRGFAVSTPKRSASAPELPTISEAALPGFNVTGWYGFLAPAGLPKPLQAKLNGEITRILSEGAAKERLIALGTEPWPGKPEEMRDWITQEYERWGKVVRQAKIAAD